MRTVLKLLRPILAMVFVGLAVWQSRLLLTQLNDKGAGGSNNTVTVKQGPFQVGISREGTIESAGVETMRAPMLGYNGITLSWVAEDGIQLKQGDLIAKTDTSDFMKEVDTTRLRYRNQETQGDQDKRNREREVDSAKMELERVNRTAEVDGKSLATETDKAQAQVGFDEWSLKNQQSQYDRDLRLRQGGIISQSKVEEGELTLRTKEHEFDKSQKDLTLRNSEHAIKKTQSQANINTAQYNLEAAQRNLGAGGRSSDDQTRMIKRQLDDMEENLAKAELRATKDGLLTLCTTWENGFRALRAGDKIWPQNEIARITNPAELQVVVRVEEAAASRLKMGQETVITARGVPGLEFKGKIVSIGALARQVDSFEDPNAQPDQRFFDVTVKILEVDQKVLRTGMKARIRFIFKNVPKAVYLPAEAVFDKPGKGQVVYVRHGKRFEERRVIISERNDEAVVVSKGVRPGERVSLIDPNASEAEQ